MAQITIDGRIGDENNTKQFIAEKLEEFKNEDIELRISSLGGNADDGLAIHDLLKGHPKNVTAKLDGMVASAATIIAMGADDVEMSKNAMFLVHKSLAGVDVFGVLNEDDIDSLIADLNSIKDGNQKLDLIMAGIFSEKTGKRAKSMLDLMAEDKWLTAEETKDLGFIDKVTSPGKQKTKAEVLKMVAEAKLPELSDDKLESITKKTTMENEKTITETIKETVASALKPVADFIKGKSDEDKFQEKLEETQKELTAQFEKEITDNAETLKAEVETLEADKKGLEEKITELEEKVNLKESVAASPKGKGDPDPDGGNAGEDMPAFEKQMQQMLSDRGRTVRAAKKKVEETESKIEENKTN